ncbi:MAG: DEAD/DEAH box helicase [Clostridia bacterium]|nr:DEAD/DEAH box helicase [Clostridia bacterium]
MTFNELNLIKPLLDAVGGAGYETPTPIQEATIPLVLSGKDVLGCAQTGTGKTAAFALPILQRLYERTDYKIGTKRPIRSLIVTPTRELAIQIAENFDTYSSGLPLKNCVIFGGVKQNPQIERLKSGVDILVATPGRLNDLIGQGFVRLDKLEIFVLDEADRMLDMGFINDIRRLLQHIPKSRQTLFFSATMLPDVEKLAMTILHNPATVKVDPVTSTVDSIEQSLYYVDKINKSKLLVSLLKEQDVKNALVFTRTKHGADRVVQNLEKLGVRAKAIHGNKSQNARQDALHRFTTGDISVLIATDIAARGIDIEGLSHVFNYDIPEDPETYIHRIGRTGRAGLSGKAISFCCYDELERLFAVEKLTGEKIPTVDSPWPMQVCTYSSELSDPRPARGQKQPGRRTDRSPNRRPPKRR